MMTIKRCEPKDEPALFALLQNEGPEWSEYYDTKKAQYQTALKSSIVYVAYVDGRLCGYCRCRDDDGFGVYVYDLLVDKAFRGRQIGRALIAQVSANYPADIVYVMSDVDGYYEKLGYRREGSIFEVMR